MSKLNITYLLGAGASAKSLPVVGGLPTRMIELAEKIQSFSLAGGSDGLGVFHEQLRTLAQKAKDFNSIDTYAKKLFLNDEKKKLNDLKTTMSIYFIFEQFSDFNSINRNKRAAIDKRYISLVSAFLERKEKKIFLPNSFSFISWNYDLQLELALEEFFNESNDYFSETLNSCGSFPCTQDYDTERKIVHLNGIAGLVEAENNNNLLIDGNKVTDIYQMLINLKPTLTALYSQIKPADPTFYFSWEETKQSIKAQEIALKIMASTNILVVIGYSFPVFNREVDRQLFLSASNSLEKLYYQDPNADLSSLALTFGYPEKHIRTTTKTESFILPFEF